MPIANATATSCPASANKAPANCGSCFWAPLLKHPFSIQMSEEQSSIQLREEEISPTGKTSLLLLLLIPVETEKSRISKRE